MDQQTLIATAFKMTMALGVVLMIFAGALWVMRRFAGTSTGFLKKATKGQPKPVEVLAYQSLGPGRGLYLIRCLDKKILVGATNTQLNAITDIVDEDDNESGDSLSEFPSTLSEKVGDSSQTIRSRMKTELGDISRV